MSFLLLYIMCPVSALLTKLVPWQTYIMFLAKLRMPHFSPGPESSDCQLFALDDIPFDSLAFSSILVTLNLVRVLNWYHGIICKHYIILRYSKTISLALQYIEDVKVGRPRFHYGIINKRYDSWSNLPFNFKQIMLWVFTFLYVWLIYICSWQARLTSFWYSCIYSWSSFAVITEQSSCIPLYTWWG